MKLKIEKDKLQHFSICVVASVLSPTLAIGLSLGKEFGDSVSPVNKWSWSDLLADGVGVVIGTIVHYFIFNQIY